MNIAGTWYNELKSKMIIKQSGANLTGTYQSGVGTDGRIYDLVGKVNTSPSECSQAISWVVVYNNYNSTAAWSGQYQRNEKTGEEKIYTFWLLTSETEPQDNWKATQIGQDIFTRDCPDEETIKRALRRTVRSEPN